MSIELSNITKLYGEQRAVNGISFSIKTGEVVGFLGPNGAGKSTTMKMLTCYIPPSSGEAKVCGFNVMDDPMEVRKRVGYLPEHNPLYLDMYVKEFLAFVAGIHKLPNATARVKEMIDLVGLGREQHKPIGALSKGYRQRVGLAQAMIHDPEVLILDEPTSGLDPNQLVEIRELIRAIGREKTVMLSTHIMQEVEAICSRVIIINRGEVVADDAVSQLSRFRTDARKAVYAEFDSEVTAAQLLAIEGVVEAVSAGAGWRLEGDVAVDLRRAVATWAQENGRLLYTLREDEQKLEDVFKRLTK
ncbi:MAG: gliding motility-associated ABC transporter ATP-binding subunit GldA [Flavobacteriales bacterium]